MSFTARYDSRCTACGEKIWAGDDVVYDDDDQLIHEECDEDDLRDIDKRWKTITE